MGYQAGDSITDFITHLDDLGVGIDGASFTVVVARKPDGTSFTPTITGLGNGVYEVAFQTANGEDGQWYLLLTDSGQSPPRSYDGVYDVDPAASQSDPGVGGAGSSRTSIRRRIGRLWGDLLLCAATANGSTTTLVDTLNLYRNDNELKGRHVYFSGGTSGNLGQSARITGNTQSTSTITFTAVPSATATGDEAEIWNTRNIGATVQEVHDQINFCLGSVADLFVTAASSSLGTFDFDSPVLDLPADWRFFAGLDWQDTLGLWHPVKPADWRLDKANRTVELLNRPRSLASGQSVRARGYTVPALLTSDSDTTGVNAEWLAYQASANLALAIAPRSLDGGAALERRAQYWQNLADQRRSLNGIRPSGTYIRLG